MSGFCLAHSILIGTIVAYGVETGHYGLAAGVFATVVVQLLWSIEDK